MERSYSQARYNPDTQGAIDSVRINRVSVVSGLKLEKMWELSFPRNKANCPWGVRIKWVSVLSGCP